jgi:hypothetical protein
MASLRSLRLRRSAPRKPKKVLARMAETMHKVTPIQQNASR